MGIEKIIQESTTNHINCHYGDFRWSNPSKHPGGQVPGQVPCDEPLVPCEPREVRKKLEHGFKEHPGVMGFYIRYYYMWLLNGKLVLGVCRSLPNLAVSWKVPSR